MEENKDIIPELEGEGEKQTNESTHIPCESEEYALAENPCTDEAACSEETAENAQAPSQDATSDAEEAVEEEPARASISWDFGRTETLPVKKESKRPFFAVFGSVVAVCLALLTLVLFMGEGGFQIIRTLYTERVVYVREYDNESGLLTPNEAADVIKKSTVTVSVITKSGRGTGSGFVYDDQGHI